MTKFSIPSSFEPTESLKYNHTPKKAAILDTVYYLENHHMHLRKRDVFRYFDVPKRTGLRWTTKNEPRRLHNRPDLGLDPRGRKRKLIRDDLRKMEDFLLSRFQCRVLNWRQLAIAVGIPEISDRTIRRYIQDLDYHSYIICDKSWISPRIKEQRINFSREIL